MKAKLTIVATTVLIAAVAFATADKVKFVWSPKANTNSNYSLKAVAKIDMGGQMADVNVTAKVSRKINEVKSDGNIVVEEKQYEMKIDLGGNTMDQPDTTATTTYKPNGEVVDRKSDEPEEAHSPRMGLAMNFVFPDKDKEFAEGETWTQKVPSDSAKGTFTFESTYTYVGKEECLGIACYKITTDFKETDAPTNMSGKSTTWVRVDTLEPVKSVVSMKNAPISPQMPPVDMDATMELVKN